MGDGTCFFVCQTHAFFGWREGQGLLQEYVDEPRIMKEPSQNVYVSKLQNPSTDKNN